MPIYWFRSENGEVVEEFFPVSACPKSIERGGVVFSLAIAPPGPAIVSTESPVRYQQWFHSEKVQEKLRTGEYEILSKSDDANQ